MTHILFQWSMREYFNCHEQCELGLCPTSCGREGFCYFSKNEMESDSLQASVPESLEKQSLIINSKYIQSSESKCFRPGEIFYFCPVQGWNFQLAKAAASNTVGTLQQN